MRQHWVRIKVGGVEKDVLVQLFERRVLTYTPSNAPAYRVEMGNVGQHYFQWRYPQLGQPWLPNADAFPAPIAYASPVSGKWQVYLLGSNGISGPQITAGSEETVPYSWRRSYVGGEAPRLMTDSKRDQGARKLFSIGMDNYSNVREHSSSGDNYTNFFNGAVSPDGTFIVVAMQTPEGGALGIQPFDRDQGYPSLITPYGRNCVYQSPTWLPDGSGLVFASNCAGKFAVYRADLKFTFFFPDGYVSAELVNVRALTNTPTVDNYFPRVSPDGAKVVFSSNRNGNGDLYLINSDGAGERRLTNDPTDDGAATWSPDGTQLIFDSNRDGDYDLYQMNLNGALPNATQLTFNTIDDRWPIWAQ